LVRLLLGLQPELSLVPVVVQEGAPPPLWCPCGPTVVAAVDGPPAPNPPRYACVLCSMLLEDVVGA
jgi:hypothetical protein